MPKCIYCNENITKFDKEICPYCGGKKPLEGVNTHTSDITTLINTVENEEITYKAHSKVAAAILGMLLGIFGADYFYLGYVDKGITKCLINLGLIGAIACALYFFTPLGIPYSILIGAGAGFILNLIYGVSYFFSKTRKDKNGVLLN